MSRHQTLSEIEGRADNPWNRPRPITATQRRESAIVLVGSGDCWCGESFPHDWPGKSEGSPHPRGHDHYDHNEEQP